MPSVCSAQYALAKQRECSVDTIVSVKREVTRLQGGFHHNHVLIQQYTTHSSILCSVSVEKELYTVNMALLIIRFHREIKA